MKNGKLNLNDLEAGLKVLELEERLETIQLRVTPGKDVGNDAALDSILSDSSAKDSIEFTVKL